MQTQDNQEHLRPEWREGRMSFAAGKLAHENPYDFGHPGRDAWAQGWEEALANAERFTPKHDGRRL